MAPVVMSTTHGEREGMTELQSAWETLGGIPLDGICGYIADTSTFERTESYQKLIEKKAENIYRNMSQKMESLPTSNQAVKNTVAITKITDLTPQEEYERIQMARQYSFEKRDSGAGRPTKRDRRDIERFKYE